MNSLKKKFNLEKIKIENQENLFDPDLMFKILKLYINAFQVSNVNLILNI